MQALDASEVRKRLAENGEFTVNDILDDEDDWEAMVDDAPTNANESAETSNTALSAEVKEPQEQRLILRLIQLLLPDAVSLL